MKNLPGKVTGVGSDAEGFYLLAFPEGEEHAQKVYVPLDVQLLIVRTITERLAGRAVELAGIKAGHPVDASTVG